MSKVKILMDSGSDVPNELMEKYGITVVPLIITIDDGEYRDFYDLTKAEFHEKLKSSKTLPKTSQPNPYTFIEYFKQFENDFDEIIYVGMSSNGSGTYNSACMAVDEYNEKEPKVKIFTFDSHQATMGIGYFAIKTGELLASGMKAEDVVKKLEEMRPYLATYIIPETLEFLKKGGRVNTVTSVIGGLLDIRPIITILGGWGRNYGKVRGAKQGNSKLLELFEKQHKDHEVYISHSNNYMKAKELMDEFKAKYENICVVFTEMGATLSSHAGPGSIGIHFLRNDVHTL